MNLDTVFTKTSKGALELTGKSRLLTREQARVLRFVDGRSSVGEILDKLGRLSPAKLQQILEWLERQGLVRVVRGNNTVLAAELGFSSTIIVDEANTQAFLEAQAALERQARAEARRAEEENAQERAALRAELAAEAQARETAARPPTPSVEANPSPVADAGERAELSARVRESEAARAQAEQEKEAMARQLREARLAAEVEARVKRRLEARAREEAEARRRAEEEARRAAEAERKAREEAERKAREEAEARRRAEEEAQREREEALRRTRELAAQRAAAEAAARAREAERAAAEAAARAAAIEAAEEALRYAEEQARSLPAEEEREREEAEARRALLKRAKTEGEAVFARLFGRARVEWRRHASAWLRRAGAVLAGLLLLVLALAHLVSFNFYAPQLARQLAVTLGEPVSIGELRLSAFPAPRWKLEQVVVGIHQDIRIGRAEIQPRLRDLSEPHMLLERLWLDDVVLDADALARLGGFAARQSSAPLRVGRVELARVKLAVPGLTLPAFGGRLEFGGPRLREAVLTTADGLATLSLEPLSETIRVGLTARRWVPPMGVPVAFDRLDVQGVVRGQTLELTSTDAELYGGSLKGKGQVSWDEGWKAGVDLDIRGVNLAPAAAAFTNALRLAGRLEAKARIVSRGSRLDELGAAPEVRATFVAREGALGNVDLARAIRGAAEGVVSGGETKFNEFSGYVQLADGRYRYGPLKLSLGMLSANGSVLIEPDRALHGNVAAELRSPATTVRVPLLVGGTLETPTLRARPVPSPAPRAATAAGAEPPAE